MQRHGEEAQKPRSMKFKGLGLVNQVIDNCCLLMAPQNLLPERNHYLKSWDGQPIDQTSCNASHQEFHFPICQRLKQQEASQAT